MRCCCCVPTPANRFSPSLCKMPCLQESKWYAASQISGNPHTTLFWHVGTVHCVREHSTLKAISCANRFTTTLHQHAYREGCIGRYHIVAPPLRRLAAGGARNGVTQDVHRSGMLLHMVHYPSRFCQLLLVDRVNSTPTGAQDKHCNARNRCARCEGWFTVESELPLMPRTGSWSCKRWTSLLASAIQTPYTQLRRTLSSPSA